MMRRSCLQIQMLVLLIALFAKPALSTELWIRPQDESGRQLKLSHADIYLDIWGGGQKVALLQNDRGVRVPLDQDWPCTAWPEACGNNLWGARLILQAEGYAPVTSRAFIFPGHQGPTTVPPSTSVTIEFFGTTAVKIAAGETKEVAISFRRSVRQLLRLQDERGNRLPGISVIDYLFFAQSNHCGGVEGDILLQAETNAAGEILIPDANAECAFQLNLRHFALQKPATAEVPIVLIRHPEAPVTTIVLRALEKQPLRLEFMIGGRPAAGYQLVICLVNCCGACCGTVGETGADGRVLVEDFYPEEIDMLVLSDRSGKELWRGKVPEIDRNGWTRIDLQKLGTASERGASALHSIRR